VSRSVKHIYGYSNDRLFGDDSSMGILPEFLLSGGIFSISGGLVWLILVQNAHFIYGTTIGGIFGILYVGFGLWRVNRSNVRVIPWSGKSVGGLFGGVLGGLVGRVTVGLASEFAGDRSAGVLANILISGGVGGVTGVIFGMAADRSDNTVVKEFNDVIVAAIFGGLCVGRVVGYLIVETGSGSCGIYGWFIGFPVGLVGGASGVVVNRVLTRISNVAQAIATMISSIIAPVCIWLRFHTVICNHCLRRTYPLRSQYQTGKRYCEHCHQEVEQTIDSGEVIFSFGRFSQFHSRKMTLGCRIFLLKDPDFDQKEHVIDVSKVYIEVKTCNKRLLERFLTYIVNYPPERGLQSVQIFYQGELAELGHNLQNALHNNFTSIKQMY
jgi:hypothetical protein